MAVLEGEGEVPPRRPPEGEACFKMRSKWLERCFEGEDTRKIIDASRRNSKLRELVSALECLEKTDRRHPEMSLSSTSCVSLRESCSTCCLLQRWRVLASSKNIYRCHFSPRVQNIHFRNLSSATFYGGYFIRIASHCSLSVSIDMI